MWSEWDKKRKHINKILYCLKWRLIIKRTLSSYLVTTAKNLLLKLSSYMKIEKSVLKKLIHQKNINRNKWKIYAKIMMPKNSYRKALPRLHYWFVLLKQKRNKKENGGGEKIKRPIKKAANTKIITLKKTNWNLKKKLKQVFNFFLIIFYI